MKVGLLSQWYDPEPGPAALPAIYGREMIRRGHSVRALTGFPNYPDGRLYDGYKIQRHMVERRDGVDVHRVALYPEHSRSALGRVLNYASFAGSAALSGKTAFRGVDAIWVYNSPVTVSLPLMIHSKMGRIPYFLHVQDLWPESLVESGMVPTGWIGDRAAGLIRRIVRATEERAAVVGVISPGVRRLILESHPGLDPDKIVYAPNPTNEALFRPVSEIRAEMGIEAGAADVVDVMYAGAIGELQGLDTVLDAAALLRGEKIRFTLVGDGIARSRLERRVADERLHNVRFLGRVEQRKIPGLISRADLQLVSLASSSFLEHTTPSKISSLLASGVPMVAQIAGDGARLIEESGAGATSVPGDSESLADAVRAMAAGGPSHWVALGERGLAFYKANLSAASTTSTILRSLAGSMSA